MTSPFVQQEQNKSTLEDNINCKINPVAYLFKVENLISYKTVEPQRTLTLLQMLVGDSTRSQYVA